MPLQCRQVYYIKIFVLPACCCRLHYLCYHSFCCWRPYCVGGSAVAFINAVACVPAVVGGHVVAVILAVAFLSSLLLFVSLLLAPLLKHAEHALKNVRACSACVDIFLAHTQPAWAIF